MKRSYSGVDLTDSPTVFIGKEVESSAAYDKQTLFIVPFYYKNWEIIEIINSNLSDVSHVYLNANHSDIIDSVLSGSYDDVLNHIESVDSIKYVTIEVFSWDPEYLMLLTRFPKLLFNISIKIPNTNVNKSRIAIKIDDFTFRASNPGVWTSKVSDLIWSMKFTNWDAYTQDKIIK